MLFKIIYCLLSPCGKETYVVLHEIKAISKVPKLYVIL